MKINISDLINSRELWAGLQQPGASIEDVDIVVFGQAFDKAASVRQGAAEGPNSIRSMTTSITPTTEDFELFDKLKVLDIGDFENEDQVELFEDVQRKVEEIVKAGKFFTMLGGDHSVTIPVFKGLNEALDDKFGIIHIDAHFDLNDTLAGSNLSHGCPERRATELEKVGGSDSIYFIGIRSIEMDEIEFMKNNPTHVISAAEFDEIGAKEAIERVKKHFENYKYIYLTLDIDCLDPGFAAGTGTPQFGGLTPRELLTFLRGIFDLPIIGFDVVEVAPSLDPSLNSTYAARKIITECWGHYCRKNNMLTK